MNTHQNLLNDMDAYQPGTDECAVWWLGQHGFAIKTRGAMLYIDAFISPHPRRSIPPLLDPGEIRHADLVLGTHDHSDHIDRKAWPAWAQASPQATFVVPAFLLPKLPDSLGLDPGRFIGLNDGTTFRRGPVTVTGVASAHEFLDRDPDTGLYPYLGYVIQCGALTLYHSGDCCVYEGLQARLKAWHFDAMFLPINGRDARRLESGCIGNMVYQEAADLAGALNPALTIPTHYDMFPLNSEHPELFIQYMNVKYPNLCARILRHGERQVIRHHGRSEG